MKQRCNPTRFLVKAGMLPFADDLLSDGVSFPDESTGKSRQKKNVNLTAAVEHDHHFRRIYLYQWRLDYTNHAPIEKPHVCGSYTL